MSPSSGNRQCVDNRSFPYPALPNDEDSIRVLTISPGDFHDPLRCSLNAVAFVKKPSYVALSYTWEMPFVDGTLLPTTLGDAVEADIAHSAPASSYTSSISFKNATSLPDVAKPRELPIIYVNDMVMVIRRNLHLAMLYLRSPTHPLTLWVDAVCINQGDKVEVSSQISIMSFIYSRAKVVVSWLGPKEFKISVNMFHHMASVWKMGQSKNLAAALAEENTSLVSRDPKVEAVARIATSTYWTRLWIVQEVCLARDLIFAYGPDVWWFDSFVNGRTVRDLQAASVTELEAPSESFAPFRAMLRLLDCRKRRYSVMDSLESLIETFRTQSCGEVMDRIYALLGMAHDVHPVSGSETIADPEVAYIDPQQEPFAKPTRGRGLLRVDCSFTLYELWAEVVKFVYFRAKRQDLSGKLGRTQALRNRERQITIVRTAGVIQEALDQGVSNDVPPLQYLSSNEQPRSPQITAIGFVTGKLLHVGPDYDSFIGSFQATQDWFSEWENHYTQHADLERLHELNDRYTKKAWEYANEDLARFRDLDNPRVRAWRLSPQSHECASKSKLALRSDSTLPRKSGGPRLFLGTGHLMGMAPPAAQVGDVIVQFYRCDAALVMRPETTEAMATEDSIGCSASSFILVGRADVVDVSNMEYASWTDSSAEDRLCESGSDNIDGREHDCVVCVDLDLSTLQAITTSIKT